MTVGKMAAHWAVYWVGRLVVCLAVTKVALKAVNWVAHWVAY